MNAIRTLVRRVRKQARHDRLSLVAAVMSARLVRETRSLLALVLLALAAPPAHAAQPAEAARLIVEAANAFRESEGRAALGVDPALASATREFARTMAKSGQYGHGADGRTPVERASAQGYEHCIVSENIAYAYRSSGYGTDALAQELMEGWKRSPGHRRNLLDREVTQTGVGVARDDSGRYFGVQMFGRPRSAAMRFTERRRLRHRRTLVPASRAAAGGGARRGAQPGRQHQHGLLRLEQRLARFFRGLVPPLTGGLLRHRLDGFPQLLRGLLQPLHRLRVVRLRAAARAAPQLRRQRRHGALRVVQGLVGLLDRKVASLARRLLRDGLDRLP